MDPRTPSPSGFFRGLNIARGENNLLVYALIFLIIGVPVGLPVVSTSVHSYTFTLTTANRTDEPDDLCPSARPLLVGAPR